MTMQKPVNADAGSELMLAHWLLEELGVPATNSDRMLVADCIRLLARKGGTTQTAAQYILESARMAELEGVTINRFWFSDRKYMAATADVSAAWTPEKVSARHEKEAAALREAYAMWCGTSEKYRKQNPWKGPIPA